MPDRKVTRPTVEALEDRTVPAKLVAVTDANELFLFNSASPDVGQRVAITGLAAGDRIRAVDYDTTTKTLVALGTSNHLYRITVPGGAATRLTDEFEPLETPDRSFFDAEGDIDPQNGQLRIVTESNKFDAQAPPTAFNYRINVSNHTVLGGAPMTKNGESARGIAGLGYAPTGGSPYVIDVETDTLARLNPASGVVTPIGPLNQVADAASLDIGPDGVAFAMLGAATDRRLYTVSLAQGNATPTSSALIGSAAALTGAVLDIAVLEATPPGGGGGGGDGGGGGVTVLPPLEGDVSDMVEAVFVRGKAKKGARRRIVQWTFTNTSGRPILAPLQLLLSGLDGRVKLRNKAGALRESKDKIEPYLLWRGGMLAPGQSVTFTLDFSVPDGVGLRYEWLLIAGDE